MAKLKAAPKNYHEAIEALAGKSTVRLGNNTHLAAINERVYSDGRIAEERVTIAVILHNTSIVKFYEDGRVTLHTDGYRTVTTKECINHFIKGRVYQKDHTWFYVINRGELGVDWANPIPFVEGLNIGAQEACDIQDNPKGRLEYLRGELRAERIGYGELHELQSLAKYIDPSDVELLEAAGIPEVLQCKP